MRASAVYYPYTEIHDPGLLRTSLLLWDEVHCIVPIPDWKIQYRGNDEERTKEMNRAAELLLRPHEPADDEKQAAHDEIVKLAENPDMPRWFFDRPTNPQLHYSIYPSKFLPATWQYLRQRRPNLLVQEHGKVSVSSWFGLAAMAILGEACAGSQKRTITDEVDSYTALTRAATVPVAAAVQKPAHDDPAQLALIPLRLLDASEIPLSRLVDLREREAKGKLDLRAMRQNYLKAVDDCVVKLTSEARTSADREEIRRVFEKSMEQDLHDLRGELRAERRNVLLSKEVWVAVAAGIGLAAVAAAAPPALPFLAAAAAAPVEVYAVGSLAKTWSQHRQKRAEVMRKHAMAWLYAAQSGPIAAA